MKLRPNLHRDWPENRFQANNADESQKRQQELMFVCAVCISDLEANNRKCSLIFPALYWLKGIAACRVSSLTQQTGVAANTFAAVRNGKCLFFSSPAYCPASSACWGKLGHRMASWIHINVLQGTSQMSVLEA